MIRAIIADDESIIREGLLHLTEQSGLDISVVALAEDGAQAVALARQFSPELVLMDINMPGLNGLSAIERIREIVPDAKIIIISGYDTFSYAQRALALGVFQYLLKPVDYRNFHQVLRAAVDAYQARMLERVRLKEDALRPGQELPGAILDYIRLHLSDEQLSLGSAADYFHISQSYLTRIVKQKTGMPFTDYLNGLRIALARTLLTDPARDMNILEISRRVGYASQHYFSRAFKNHTGLSPSQYRKKNGAAGKPVR